jgi:hypothetical protein
MWRDELQAWIISRDSRSQIDIFQNLKYEGHPALWFLLLWPLTRFTENPAFMQYLNLLILGGTVFLIAFAAPAPRWLRSIAALGYFPVYEYGSIARNYGIGLFLLVAFCVVFPYRRERPLLLCTLLFLAANTSIHACLLVIALLFTLVVETIVRPPESSYRTAVWAGLAFAAAGVALAAYQMQPPPDSGVHIGWFFGFSPSNLQQTFQAIFNAYLPLPIPGPAFWETNYLATLSRYPEITWIAPIILLVLISLALIRRPLALGYYLIGSLGLLAFFYVKVPGYLRHHGFLFICFGTSLWLAGTMQPVTLPKLIDSVGQWSEKAITAIFAALLIVQVVGGGIAVAGEYSYVFSAAESTAQMIHSHGIDRLPLIADYDMLTVPVVGYLKKDRVYYPAGGRFGSYILWDSARVYRYDVWDRALLLAKSLNSPVVVLVDKDTLRKKPPPFELRRMLEFVGCREGEIVPSESYCVFLLRTAQGRP